MKLDPNPILISYLVDLGRKKKKKGILGNLEMAKNSEIDGESDTRLRFDWGVPELTGPKVNQLTEEVSLNPAYKVSPRKAYSVGKKNVSTTGKSLKKTGKMNASTSGNGKFSFINSFEALNVDNMVTKEFDSGDKAFMSGVQEEGQSSTPFVEKINMFDQHLLEGNCVLTDDEGKSLEKVEYSGDHDSEDEVEPIDNEMTYFLASKLSGVGYGTNSLLEQ
nr:hypothetical protein [Tanacetum cinerariifolium]